MDNTRINILIEKYLDGATTETEEQALADYFAKAGDNIPEEWMPYRALFAYIDAEKEAAAEQPKTAENENLFPVSSTPTQHSLLRRKIFRQTVWLAAAACALLIIMLRLQPNTNGNFAVIDGKVYTSKSVVESEALDALQQVGFNEDADLDALDMMIQ